VGVDIGGTNTRVALDTGSSDEPYVQVRAMALALLQPGCGVRVAVVAVELTTCARDEQIAKFRASSSKHIVEGLAQVARQVADILGVPASGACLAGAGRISDDGLSVRSRHRPIRCFHTKRTRFSS
jgi:glucokinase